MILALLCLVGGCFMGQLSFAQTDSSIKPFTVVIDAGHGGKDPGAIGKLSKEKNLNLQVALQTGKMIQEQFPEVRVVYTRKTDVFLPLQKRADIVNEHHADLFISIHTNSAESRKAKGVETFVLGTEKLDDNLDVAMRENAVMKLEADYQTAYQGFDPTSIDSYIMFELMQNVYLEQSLQYATFVQQQFVNRLQRSDRGVRQAAFWVLLKSACPSILLEMGFISNPEEEKYLISTKGQQEMASALCKAFAQFIRRSAMCVEGTEKIDDNQNNNVTESGSANKIIYAIQVLASRTLLKEDDPRLCGLRCNYVKVDGWYKYYYGESTDRKEVEKQLKKVRHHFPDCWIIQIPK